MTHRLAKTWPGPVGTALLVLASEALWLGYLSLMSSRNTRRPSLAFVWRMAAAIIFAMLLLTPFFSGLLNGVVRERIIRDANSREGTSLSLGAIHYSILANRFNCDSLRYIFKRNGHVQFDLAADTFACSDINWLRLVAGEGVSCRELTLTGLRLIWERNRAAR